MLTKADYRGFIFAIVAAIIGGVLVTGANYFFLTDQPVPISKFLTFTFYSVFVGFVIILVFGRLERYFVKD